MEVLALNLNGGGGFVLGAKRKAGPVALSHRATLAVTGWRFLSGDDTVIPGFAGIEDRVWTKVGGRPPRASPFRSIVVRAIGKKKNHDGASSSGNNDPSIPEEDNVQEGAKTDYSKSNSNASSKKSHHSLSDWRDFRANLVALEQEQLVDPDFPAKHPDSQNRKVGLKWAHPISAPETGCVLVATEKLDGVASFERTVVLLLRVGSRDPREGPFGIILNKPLQQKIKHMKPSNPHLATTFAECSLHRGGPLDANMFLFNTGDSTPLPGFEKVVPGVCFGARNSLDEAAALIKKGVLMAHDFRFFIGYAGWQFDQLLDEIASDYWVVAACSSNLISGASNDASSNLWEEILQLMGGQYSELSRKPKQDSS